MPKTLPMVDMSAPVCCAPVAAGPMSDAAALEVALRLKALADPARVKIMSYLFSSSAGEENSGDLAAALGLTESTVSHHLTQLRQAGLVESERRGMNVYHRAAPRCCLAHSVRCSIPTAARSSAGIASRQNAPACGRRVRCAISASGRVTPEIDGPVANRQPSGLKPSVLICAKGVDPREIAGYLRESHMVVYD